jgi:pilus assembly protein FimV
VRAPASTPARQAAAPKPAAGEGKQVTVQNGDTAGKIAAAVKPPSVSLDQMLVALLSANPEAFIGGNVNRLKSGVVLDIPSVEQAGLVPPDEAGRTIVAQSRDFNEFRRRLAEGLPVAQLGTAERQTSGKLQARVEEKKATPATPDKLTLSKGAVQGKAAEDKIARDRAAQDAAVRVAELNKNISDLNKLSSTGAAAPSGTASSAKPGIVAPLGTASVAKPASAPTVPPVSPMQATPAAIAASKPASTAVAMAPASAPMASASAIASPVASAPVLAAASAPASATAPASAASAAPAPASAVTAPVAAPVTPIAATSKPKAATPPPRETSLFDDLMENPIVPATVGGVLVLLLGFGFYRAQQKKKSTQVDSSFLESRLQPDSFFGASGGQRIDTNEGNATGSSMVYSPSQLDAAGDVDPVAEADVYLAYGRDLQAEEILKEAMRTTPQRVAVHSKLLEIYSKRRDVKAFELVATEAYSLTRGAGPDWEHICELGQELDSSNPLYRPGGHPSGAAAAEPPPADKFSATTVTQAVPVAAPAAGADIDLDLDFSIGDDTPAPAASTPAPMATLPMAPSSAAPPPALDMDFGTSTVAMESPAALGTISFDLSAPPQAGPAHVDVPDLNLSDDGLSVSHHATSAPAADPGMIEFDLGALSLDLGTPAAAAPSVPHTEQESPTTADAPLSTAGFDDTGGDPLATKLALAEEFNAIGDPDGARSLAEEVLAEASGDLKNKAKKFLAEIG